MADLRFDMEAIAGLAQHAKDAPENSITFEEREEIHERMAGQAEAAKEAA